MRITSQYKVDLFQLKNAGNPVALMDAIRLDQARKLGEKISELFPHVKNPEASFQGDMPVATMNREHEYNDRYDLELFVFTKGELTGLISQLNSDAEELAQERDSAAEADQKLYAANIVSLLLTQ